MQIVIMFFLATVSGWAADSGDLLARAQKIVPEAATYRKISGSVENCPGEDTILWRKTPQGPYLQLTPRLGFSGFEKTGWVNRPDGATLPDCIFESKIDVRAGSIQYQERENCPTQKWQRTRSVEIEKKGEFGIIISSRREITKAGTKDAPIAFKCEMIVKK